MSAVSRSSAKSVSSYSRQQRREIRAIMDCLEEDDEYAKKFRAYALYCDLVRSRGYGDRHDLPEYGAGVRAYAALRKDFASEAVRGIYDETCLGYDQLYLDKPYLDISYMRVGDSLLNLDLVWDVIAHAVAEAVQTCMDREIHFRDRRCYCCDRCGQRIYNREGTRFDPLNNLLHCQECAKVCSHWEKGRKRYGKVK